MPTMICFGCVSMFSFAIRSPSCVVAASLLLASSTLWAADPVIVQGAGVVVTGVDLLAEVQRLPPEARVATLARKENVAQLGSNIYLRRALAAEAEKEGLANDPLVAAALRIARDRVLSDAHLVQLDAKSRPADAALDAVAASTYKANPARFEVPAQIRASHILVAKGPDAKAAAEKLLAELKKGADFAALAKEHSADTGSAIKGGDLGFFGKGRMVPPFEEAAFALNTPGELSGLVESEFGFHIIKLEASRPAGTLPFDEVRDALRREASAKITNEARSREQKSVMAAARPDTAAIEAFAATPR